MLPRLNTTCRVYLTRLSVLCNSRDITIQVGRIAAVFAENLHMTISVHVVHWSAGNDRADQLAGDGKGLKTDEHNVGRGINGTYELRAQRQ